MQEHSSCEEERVERDVVLFLGNDGLINPKPEVPTLTGIGHVHYYKCR